VPRHAHTYVSKKITWRLKLATTARHDYRVAGWTLTNVEKISISLPSDMVAVLKAAVESGEYSSASEVVRDALRAWKLKRKMEGIELDELRRLVQEGSESGPGIDGQELKKLRAKYTTISDKVGD